MQSSDTNKRLIEAFEEYLRIIRALDDDTVSAYISDLKQCAEAIAKPLLQIESGEVIDFLSHFGNKRTLNRKLSSLNTFFAFCHREGLGEKRLHIPMAKVPKRLPKYLSFEEVMRGVATIDRSTLQGLRDYALILFLYASGCRISEALAAQRSDIRDGWLTIRYAKGEKERTVPLAPVALEALEAYLKEERLTSGALWLNYKGEPLSRISAYKIVKKYLGVSPHVLRHSFATALIVGGADLRVVQELLGHASLETTQIYTHIQKAHLQETVRRHHPLERH